MALLIVGLLFMSLAGASYAQTIPCPAFPASNACSEDRCSSLSPGSNAMFLSTLSTAALLQTIVIQGTGTNTTRAGKCCNACRTTPNCIYWEFQSLTSNGGKCFLLGSKMKPECAAVVPGTTNAHIIIGGKCNPYVVNDPHFQGARGTRFDFNGEPEKTFCLVTDRTINVNMKLRGYLDPRGEKSGPVGIWKDGKAVRTWIKDLGIVWKMNGTEHKMVVESRDGKQQERGDGFIKRIVVNDVTLPRFNTAGQVYLGPGGLLITYVGPEKTGRFEVDYYTVAIGELIDLDVRLRVAHPMLQSPNDAETHINVGINSIEDTEDIHGVLGQTYRQDRVKRAVDYSALAALLHGPVQADGATGKGFLDGEASDYIAKDIFATDCPYSTYGRAGPTMMNGQGDYDELGNVLAV